MSGITRALAKQIGNELEEAMAAVAERHGMELQWKGVTYTTAGMVRPRCELKASGAAMNEFAVNAPIYGLKAEDFGKQFVAQGRTFEVTGISTRSPKRPILCREIATGKNFKFTAEGAKRGLVGK